MNRGGFPYLFLRDGGLRLLLLLSLSLWATTCGSEKGRNSLLLVTIDTLRADRLGCTGREGARTPVLDALAGEGVLFDCCIVTAPITLPSHATIMTGLHPHEMEVRDNRPFSLSAEAETLAEDLKARGYRTLAVVSGEPLAPGCGLEQGFDRYRFEPLPRRAQGLLLEAPADVTSRSALETCRDLDRDRPFFLWVHFFDPHVPYEPPPRIGKDFDDPYDGEVAFVDEQVGRLLRGLEQMGLMDGTVTAVISDHGEGLGDHGEPTHAFYLFDTTIKVPLIVKGPGIPGGRRWTGQVRVLDLKDALLRLTGDGEGEGPPVPGADLAAFLRKPGAPLPELPAFSESLFCYRNFRWAQMTAIRTERFKLIRGARDDLYYLPTDPGEAHPFDPGDPDITTEGWRLRPEMNTAKTRAGSRIARGPLFQASLPGYFGGALQGSGLFLREPANSALPHPPERSAFINNLLRAVALCDSGGLNRARMLLDDLVREEPGNPTTLFWLGRALRETGEREGSPALIREARDRFREVLETDPGNSDAFHMSVWCLLQTGDFEAAEGELNRWCVEHESLAETWELYGYLYTTSASGGMSNPLFDLEKGFGAFDRSLEAKDNNPGLLQRLIDLSTSSGDPARRQRYADRLKALASPGRR